MTIEDALVEFALEAKPSRAARQMMRLSLLDWSACALAGQNQDVSRIVRQMVLDEGGSPEAAVIGSPDKIPARAAALVNGTTSHALDYDDTHFAHIGHPSVAVVPAALAVAEKVGAQGCAFLNAALVGAEASVRVGLWLGRSHYQAGFHQTATAGLFGATLASGRLLGLEPGQMRHAIGIASTRASGLKAQFGTMGKPFHAGLAASGGVESALLAKAGFQSDPLGLSGPNGFGATHAGEADSAALDDLGRVWLFEGISHKFHACCHGLHAMLEAFGELAGQYETGDVAKVTIATHPRWQSVCNQHDPATGLATKFSYTHAAAMALAGLDTAALDSFSNANAIDPTLVETRALVDVRFDASLAETASSVSVVLNDGQRFRATHDLSTPMPLSERRTKLLAKSASLLGEPTTSSIWSAIEPDVDLPALIAVLAVNSN